MESFQKLSSVFLRTVKKFQHDYASFLEQYSKAFENVTDQNNQKISEFTAENKEAINSLQSELENRLNQLDIMEENCKKRLDKIQSDFDENISICNSRSENLKKEISIMIIVFVIGILCSLISYILTKQLLLLIVFILLTIGFEFIYINRYKSLEEKQKRDIENEFISVVSFFKIYLKNGMNVYTSLKEVSSFVSIKLKERFDQLIIDIDEDKSVEPFIKFAKKFNTLIIEQMMISIYQMVDEGINSPYFNQFETILSSLSNEMHQKNLYTKETSLSNCCASALIGAAILIVLITLGVVSVIGEMINGL